MLLCPALFLVRSLLCARATGRVVRRRGDGLRHREWTASGLERFESQVGGGGRVCATAARCCCCFVFFLARRVAAGISFSNDERG